MNILSVYGIPDDNRVTVVVNGGRVDKFDSAFSSVNKLTQLLDQERFNVINVVLGGMQENLNVPIPKLDAIYFSVCNYDNQKKSIESFLQKFSSSSIPILNHPDGIIKSTRDAIYNQFKESKEFLVPKTVRITPKSVKDVFDLVKEHAFTFPFIFRSIGENNAKNMERIDSVDDREKLEKFAYDGREFYLIQYHEYKSSDGLYRKYRALVIDGELILRHLIFSDHWKNANFDGHQIVLARTPEIINEELSFLTKQPSQKLVDTANELYKYLGLDFFGFDFSMDEEGNVLLFEANSCMMAYYSLDYGPKHLQEDAKKIKEKIENMFLKRVYKDIKI